MFLYEKNGTRVDRQRQMIKTNVLFNEQECLVYLRGQIRELRASRTFYGAAIGMAQALCQHRGISRQVNSSNLLSVLENDLGLSDKKENDTDYATRT